MSSASELFHISSSRRSRFHLGSRHGSSSELGGPTSPDRSRNHNRNTNNNTICNDRRRRQQKHYGAAQERDTSRVNEGSGQGNGSTNLDNFDGGGNRGRRHIGNDRLPGAVLLARERLLERLRGVSLSANRRNNRASSHSNRNEPFVGDASRVAGLNEDLWDVETLRETLDRVISTESIDQTEQLSVTQGGTSKRRPPGLTQNALAHLQLEIFTETPTCDGEIIMLRASQECSICLEKFAEGDELVCLPCAHRFHFVCFEPWVRTCGDCPYCRREVVVSFK